ncbi:50S ribosome-binding protein YggL [Vibrio sp. FNV 38]|nr:50S ribosome-binding protein YggL [Vibrio sp. FNV 38]
MAKNRSKRLRKKLYVDEFTVLGFGFSCQVDLNSELGYEAILNDFFDFLEARNLIMGGGANQHAFDGFVIGEGRYDSATDADRTAVQQWLEQRSECSEVKVSELIDSNGED